MEESTAIKVMIADDHEIYRDGLRLMLKKQPAVEWLGEAANGKELVEMIKVKKPDVVLLDILMPVKDGIETTRYLHRNYPDINVIALSMFNEENLVVDMLEAGAKGYMLKNADKEEIVEAIQSVCRQVPYYCKSTTSKLAMMIGRSRFNPFYKYDVSIFTPKEIEIIKLVCHEMTNKQIGEKLFISGRTVEGHRLKIQDKINVKSTAGIVIYAIKHGIHKPS